VTKAQILRLRKAETAAVEGQTLDRAWRALERHGYVRSIGSGRASYTALYEITAAGLAALARLPVGLRTAV